MAKEEQIKTSIDLTGEKEYRAACTNINIARLSAKDTNAS